MDEEIVKTDILCVGGGPGGLMAAIRAGELGAKVVLAEKGNTLRSGAGATGNDHFVCYIPEVHGSDIKPIVEQRHRYLNARGRMRSLPFIQAHMEKSTDIVKLWDSWGIPMKYQGRYEFAGHAYPGRRPPSLKYAGQDQKKILTREAIKRGVEIQNRVMVFDIRRENEGFISLGISTREQKIIVFHSKSVILATGLGTRLYPGPTPGWMFNLAYFPGNTGDGRIMAYKAGAELANLELNIRWAGPKYFARCGKATWVGVFRDPQGKAIGPFINAPDKKHGDATSDIWPSVFDEYSRSGRGPVYMDCTGISDEDYQYMVHWLRNEGNAALVNNLLEESIDLKKDPIEFMTYEMLVSGGVNYNEKCETSVKGLYATGDETFGGISCAACFGWIAGENAVRYSQQAEIPDLNDSEDMIKLTKDVLMGILKRNDGVSWKEANVALQQIMQDHVSFVRSESMLDAGLNYLRRVKSKVHASLGAKNQHELMHCLEVLNLLDLGELTIIAAKERRETRGAHKRPDYPFTNPLLEKLCVIKQESGKPVVEWKEIEDKTN